MNPPPPLCPTPSLTRAAWIEREAFIEAFEAAYLADPGADPADYLPPPGHPLRRSVSEELVRIDLEHHWAWGLPRWLEEYRPRFPELFADRTALAALAGEEFRLRVRAGHAPTAAEYRDRFGVELNPGDEDPTIQDGPLSSVPRTSRTAARAAMPHVGDEFLEYRLTAELGSGSCGRVFLAERGGRRYALKIAPDLGGELEALARLRHPNIVRVVAVHHAGPVQAVAMPYLGATTLVHVLRHVTFRRIRPMTGEALFAAVRRDLPTSTAATDERRRSVRRLLARMTYVDAVMWVAARMAAGLAHAHDRGVQHRDLKPANVLLADDGRPVLLDFNLAAAAGGAPHAGGTLPYMAPEGLEAFLGRPRPIDARADLYSLGVIIYQLLTARLPYAPPRDTSPTGLAAALQERFTPPRDLVAINPDVPPAAAAVVRRLLEPNPAQRYPGARQLQKELARCLRRTPRQRAVRAWHKRPLGAMWLTTFGMLLLAIAGWLIGLWGWQ